MICEDHLLDSCDDATFGPCRRPGDEFHCYDEKNPAEMIQL